MSLVKVIKLSGREPQVVSIKGDFREIQALVGGHFEVYDVIYKNVPCQAFCLDEIQGGHPYTFVMDTESSPYMKTMYSTIPEEERVVTLYGDIVLASHDENGEIIDCRAI